MELICYNELDLDDENNFTMHIGKDNAVESQKFINGDEYLISGLDLKRKAVVDCTKWKDYDKIKAIFDSINSAKKINK